MNASSFSYEKNPRWKLRIVNPVPPQYGQSGHDLAALDFCVL